MLCIAGLARLPQVSLPLAVYALLLSTALALPAGLVMAHRRTGWASGVLTVITQLGVAVPNFWLGLLLALVLVECVDLVFAVDSVPAIFAITTDPFIVYTSNIFAILGLRALYFALAAMIHRFKYLKYALALVLVFIGGLGSFHGAIFGAVDVITPKHRVDASAQTTSVGQRQQEP